MTFALALSQIPTEKQIRKHLIRIIFGKRGVWCPKCGKKNKVQCLEHNKRWRCARCRNKFSLTSVTWRPQDLKLVADALNTYQRWKTNLCVRTQEQRGEGFGTATGFYKADWTDLNDKLLEGLNPSAD